MPREQKKGEPIYEVSCNPEADKRSTTVFSINGVPSPQKMLMNEKDIYASVSQGLITLKPGMFSKSVVLRVDKSI